MPRAIVVLGHGSRAETATRQFLQLVDLIRQRTADVVLPAFMELAEPTLEQTVPEAIAKGADEVVVVPCFLFVGRHIERDVPAKLRAFAEEHPAVRFSFGSPLGPDPRLVDILLERIGEAGCPA
ncbi:MAG: CbiX/SirB N-terminal domain-containing protein [Actinobacteria bacterium]|nr:CbiX/SirB N-terminal domain-containing protein [Actinomycetota bacterium]